MKIKSSPELYSFYCSYRDWLEAGASGDTHLRNSGLCGNCFDFFFSDDDKGEFAGEKSEELHDQFSRAGLNPNLPFNRTTYNRDWNCYADETLDSVCHLNEKRVQWVYDRIKDYEEDK